MKMRRESLRFLVSFVAALALILTMSYTVLAATTAEVTITYTPTYIALTNGNASWAIGTVDASGTYWWTNNATAPDAEPFIDAAMNTTITNTGSVTEDIDIKASNPTGGVGHTISTDDTPAEDEVSIRAGITGTANEAGMIQVLTTDTELVDSLASSGTMMWCMELETGTFTDGTEKSSTVTLTASAAD